MQPMHTRAASSRHFQSRGGNVVPRRRYTVDDVSKAQAEVLYECYGHLKAPAKAQAADTGQSVRACRNQQAGVNCMQLTEFFNACLDNPRLQEWGKRMMGCESETDPEFVQGMSLLMNAMARRNGGQP